MDCIFCKIGSGKISAKIIYEDDSAVAFLDLEPIAPGHTLVIPKDHAKDILELPDKGAGDFLRAVKRATDKLNSVLNPDGFTIGINQGKVSGQSVDHLHIHILPRFEGDGGGSLHSVVSNSPSEEQERKLEEIII